MWLQIIPRENNLALDKNLQPSSDTAYPQGPWMVGVTGTKELRRHTLHHTDYCAEYVPEPVVSCPLAYPLSAVPLLAHATFRGFFVFKLLRFVTKLSASRQKRLDCFYSL